MGQRFSNKKYWELMMKQLIILISLICFCSFSLQATENDEPNDFTPVPTLNKMGWAIGPQDEYSQQWVVDSLESEGVALEVAAAFGFTSEKLLRKCDQQGITAKKLIVNDLDGTHLDQFQERISDVQQLQPLLMPGDFLNELDIEANSINTILASRVLHMLNGEQIVLALNLFYNWLQEDGKLYLIVGTPYNKSWKLFLEEYDARKQRGDKFPGFVDDPSRWCPERAGDLPEYVHFLDLDILSDLAQNIGFTVVKSGYIFRQNSKDNFLDDKFESAGLIMKKHKKNQLLLHRE